MRSVVANHPNFNKGKDTELYFNFDDIKELETQFNEIWDRGDYSKGLIKKDMIVIDLGANIGLSALYFKDHARVIYALEPSPLYYECLVKNTKPYKNIKPFNLACGYANKPMLLRTNNSSRIPESFFGDGQNGLMVNMVTLEKFMQDNGIDHVDLLKVDTEGSEYLIFPSNGFIAVADKIDHIIGEGHYMMNIQPDFIPLILKDYGFKTEFLDIPNMHTDINLAAIDDNVKAKSYRIMRNTIFFAERES